MNMERSKLDIASNDIWFSDHHLIDVFVKSTDGKKVIRPWLTVFFDARSSRVVGAVVKNADPNATTIKQCFRLGVEQNGVPSVLTDIYLAKQVFHITPLRVILKRKGSDNNGKTEEIHH